MSNGSEVTSVTIVTGGAGTGSSLAFTSGEIVDDDAIEIGGLYERARSSLVDSVRYQIECGRLLLAKKDAMKHGQWLSWLRANDGVLGFDTPRTAQMLIKTAKAKLTSHFDEMEAAQISRQTWGNTNARVTLNTGENEWYTPDEHLSLARAVLGGIDLDPASSHVANRAVRAAKFFSADTNGLSQEWHGRIWLNPPYAQPLISRFADKLVSEYRAGNVSAAIALTNDSTDTAWFHQLASACSALCFTRGRIRFVSPRGDSGTPTQGQAFFYFGHDVDIFADVFGQVGWLAAGIAALTPLPVDARNSPNRENGQNEVSGYSSTRPSLSAIGEVRR